MADHSCHQTQLCSQNVDHKRLWGQMWTIIHKMRNVILKYRLRICVHRKWRKINKKRQNDKKPRKINKKNEKTTKNQKKSKWFVTLNVKLHSQLRSMLQVSWRYYSEVTAMIKNQAGNFKIIGSFSKSHRTMVWRKLRVEWRVKFR